MSEPCLAILGAGGHARVVLDAVRASGANVAGCIAPDAPGAGWPDDVPYLGDDDAALAALDRAGWRLINGLGSIGQTQLRTRVYTQASAAGFSFHTLIHPGAIVARDAVIGAGAQVLAGAIVQTGARLGVNVVINTGAIIEHDARIGDHVHVAPGVTLSGGVHIGAGAHLGTGAVIVQGVRIGANALIGAGAVVIRDVPEGACVAGVPARNIRPDGQGLT